MRLVKFINDKDLNVLDEKVNKWMQDKYKDKTVAFSMVNGALHHMDDTFVYEIIYCEHEWNTEGFDKDKRKRKSSIKVIKGTGIFSE